MAKFKPQYKDSDGSIKDLELQVKWDNVEGKPTIPSSLPANGGNADTVDNVHMEWAGSQAWDSTSWLAGWTSDGTKIKAVPRPTIPTVPTKTSQLTNDSGFLTSHQSLANYATKTDVSNAVAGIVNSAPAALDTLKELSDALGNDPNFATTVATQIGNKADRSALSSYVKFTDMQNKQTYDKQSLQELLNDTYQAKGNYLTSHQDISGKLDNAGDAPTTGNGAAIVQPGGSAAVSIRTTSGTSRDVGIFRLSEDNAYIANSSDNNYTFAVFDTDLTTDFSNENDASFSVSSNGAGAKIRGNTVLHSGNIGSYAITRHQDISGKVDKVSSGRPGVTKLYRKDADDAYNVQTWWNGSHWVLQGYYGDTYYAPCAVGYAESAGSAPANGGTSTFANKVWTTSNPNDWYINSTWDGHNFVTSAKQESSGNFLPIWVDHAGSASVADSVTWSNVSGRPTNISSFTNDSGYATQTWVNNKGYTTNTGTVTSVAVKMNGSTKGTITSSGTIDLGTVLTSQSLAGYATTDWVRQGFATVYYVDQAVANAGGGGSVKLYQHFIRLNCIGGGDSAEANVSFTLISQSNSPMTLSDIYNHFDTDGSGWKTHTIPAAVSIVSQGDYSEWGGFAEQRININYDDIAIPVLSRQWSSWLEDFNSEATFSSPEIYVSDYIIAIN